VFQVKICGVTSAADAALVAAAGADAVGLNFVPGSPRQLDASQARVVAAAVPAGVLRVGVFAGATAGEIVAMARAVTLDAIQLHGHLEGDRPPIDPPGLCQALGGLPVIRAVRLDDTRPPTDGLATARRWIAAATAAGHGPVMVIVDAAVPRGTAAGLLGGTGERADWAALAATPRLAVPTAVAGGLTPANVADAIRITGLGAVDTASGVESAPGRKDREKVREFVAAARRAIERLPERSLRLTAEG